MTDYKNLIAWQKSRTLVKEIYLLTERLPKSELFGLTNQIRRAVISIPSNIAEGYNRNTVKEYIHFLRIAKGSAAEVETQLMLCADLAYLSTKDIENALKLIQEVLCMIGTLIINNERKCEQN